MLKHRGGLLVSPRTADDPSVPAKGSGGDGFVCCGVFKHYLVPNVPAHLSLSAELSVTQGVARALYLKGGSCASFPDDLKDEACIGHCDVRWLTRFNPYDGAPVSTSHAQLAVPNGVGEGCPARCPPDLREAGDWYIGVQALPGTEAQFSLSIELVEPERVKPGLDGHVCDPNAPSCRGPYTLTLESGATRRSCPRREGGALLAATGCAIAVVHAMTTRGGRTRRTHWYRLS